MEPDSLRTKRLESPAGFSVGTDFECGHGIATLAEDGVVEIEIIAYCKDPRYLCARLEATRDCQAQLRIIPDRQSGMGFSKFHSWIWVQRGRGSESDWHRLSTQELQVCESHMLVRVTLQAGESCVLSSEPYLPYSATVDWLHSLDGKHGFNLAEIGQSIEGRRLWSLQSGQWGEANSDNGDPENNKPGILVIAGEHGTEFAGEHIARGMLQAVLADNTEGKQLRARYHWSFILNANPDGNVNGWHQYNRADWNKHAYPFPEDISWHHEFKAWLEEGIAVSPETVAVGTHVLKLKPSLLFNMHSWQGNNGNLGVYRSGLSVDDFPLLMHGLELEAAKLTAHLQVECLIKDSGNLASGHLGDTLAMYSVIPSFSPEGHMIIGEQNLNWFGAQWILNSLQLPEVQQELVRIHSNVDDRYAVFSGASLSQ